jgi:hypothetical protein
MHLTLTIHTWKVNRRINDGRIFRSNSVPDRQRNELLGWPGSAYISSGPVIYICTAVTTTSSTWRQISSTSSSFKTVSATYSLDPVADDTIVMTGASAFNVALPLATAVAVGKTYTVVRAGGANGALTGAINANGTIGSTSAAFGSNPAQIMVRSDGTQWWQIQSTGTVTVT